MKFDIFQRLSTGPGAQRVLAGFGVGWACQMMDILPGRVVWQEWLEIWRQLLSVLSRCGVLAKLAQVTLIMPS